MKNNIIQSTLTHGGGSNRVYLMHLHPGDFPYIIYHLDNLSREHHYTKIFAKVPSGYGPSFISAGYIIEASIPSFFNGEKDALFLAKYTSEERRSPEIEHLQAFQNMLLAPPTDNPIQLDAGYTIRKLTIHDLSDMICLFKEVFETYPFPIFEPNFLLKSMQEEGTRYFGVYENTRLIAISSAECNTTEKNAEMTDFAVLPEYRGKRLAIHLLSYMEKELASSDYKTLYTICRLKSLSMNKTFYNSGYKYTGTLTKNTQISGNIESMNVWYKRVN